MAHRRNSWKVKLAVFIATLTAVSAPVYFAINKRAVDLTQQTESPPIETTTEPEVEQPESEEPQFEFIDLQPAVKTWAKEQNGTSSVVIYDLNNDKTAASLNPDEQYFTASIYKLYVAYIGYQKVADGTYSLGDPYLSGYTRGKCLDAMIRSSYSPCGEKMWAELGKEGQTVKLKGYGLKNTSMSGLYTSAGDAAKILERLFDKTDLTPKHWALVLDSLEDQPAKYRSGLPSGFSGKAKVYNKVGWNENLEWHDTAIVTTEEGRSYVISVFTRGVGRDGVVSLAKSIAGKID